MPVPGLLAAPAVKELAVLVGAAIIVMAPAIKNAAEALGKGLSQMADAIKESLSKSEPKAEEQCPEEAGEQEGAEEETSGQESSAQEGSEKEIARQKQDGHIKDTPQHKNRVKQGKPTSTFDDAAQADRLTQEAWKKGKPVEGRPNVRDHDFGRRVGTNPNGEAATKVRVHEDGAGRIHGHPK